MRVKAYRLESGTWKLKYAFVATTSYVNSTTSRYAARVTLGPGRWRIRAYDPVSSTHVDTYGSTREFVIR